MQSVELEAPAARQQARAGKYLLFSLGKERYGIQVGKVREIIGNQETANVPYTPAYVRGIINLRGKVIPVIDLRMKFGLATGVDNERACVIVVQNPEARDMELLGVLVDSVSEVLTFADHEIEDTPTFPDGTSEEALLGIAKGKTGIYILLDIDRVLDRSELRLTGLTL